jgi:hypothetical protein
MRSIGLYVMFYISTEVVINVHFQYCGTVLCFSACHFEFYLKFSKIVIYFNNMILLQTVLSVLHYCK